METVPPAADESVHRILGYLGNREVGASTTEFGLVLSLWGGYVWNGVLASKKHVRVPTPAPQKCDLTWK